MASSDLYEELLARLDAKFPADGDQMTMSEFICANTTMKGKPFSFKGYEFQRQIADDMHRNLSVIKPSQVGLSELQVRKFLCFLKRTTAVTGIFALPNDEMMKRMSQTRVKPIIDRETVFNQHNPAEKPVRSLGTYQIDSSFGFMTGGKEGDATSIAADLLFTDEVDLIDQEILALYASRLQGSSLRVRQGFSTPTFEGYGIHSSFEASDQHEYLCRCTACNHWNLPTFTPDFIHLPGLPSDLNDLSEIDPEIAERLDFDGAFVACEHCGQALDLGNPDLREWVPRHANRLGRGYWVRPFSTDRLDIRYIVEQLLDYKRKNSIRRWYNTVLGEAYNDSDSRLSLLEIEAVMRGETVPDVSSDTPVAVGIDVGQTCHLTLAHLGHGAPVVFGWRQVPSDQLSDELKQIRERYNVVAGGMDLNPYGPLARQIRDESNGVIVPVEYATTGSAAPMTLIKDELETFSHVRSNRTLIIDETVRKIRKREVTFVGYGPQKSIIQTHLQDMVRIEVPEKPAVWNKLTGSDHYFHSLGYLLHSLRVKEVQLLNRERDDRIMSVLLGILPVQQNAEQLGVRGRSKNPSVLGLA